MANIGNINNNVSQNLQGVAKERSEYIIEDSIKKLEENLKKSFDEAYKRRDWYTFKNLKITQTQLKGNNEENHNILTSTGSSGKLIMSVLNIGGIRNETVQMRDFSMKVSLDEQVIFYPTVGEFGIWTAYENVIGIINDRYKTILTNSRVSLVTASGKYLSSGGYAVSIPSVYTSTDSSNLNPTKKVPIGNIYDPNGIVPLTSEKFTISSYAQNTNPIGYSGNGNMQLTFLNVLSEPIPFNNSLKVELNIPGGLPSDLTFFITNVYALDSK